MFQLFDHNNHVNKDAGRYMFTTEGHLIPISRQLTQQPWLDDINLDSNDEVKDFKAKWRKSESPVSDGRTDNFTSNVR